MCAVALFSQVHDKFHLSKPRTVFLAYQIYVEFNQKRSHIESIPESYVLLICINLAMKFQEIYPPELKVLAQWMGVYLPNHSTYLRH